MSTTVYSEPHIVYATNPELTRFDTQDKKFATAMCELSISFMTFTFFNQFYFLLLSVFLITKSNFRSVHNNIFNCIDLFILLNRGTVWFYTFINNWSHCGRNSDRVSDAQTYGFIQFKTSHFRESAQLSGPYSYANTT